ncbi:MAG: PAS domain-containing sensor histidine kinase [Chloroflexota bacterium]
MIIGVSGQYPSFFGNLLTPIDYLALVIVVLTGLIARFALLNQKPGYAVYWLGTGIASAGLIGSTGSGFQINFFFGAMAVSVLLVGAFQTAKQASIFGAFTFGVSVIVLLATNTPIANSEFIQMSGIFMVIYLPIYFGVNYREHMYQRQLKVIADDEQLFRELFHDAPIPSAIFDEFGYIMDLNQATTDLFKINKEDSLGLSCYNFVYEEDISLVANTSIKLQKTGQTQKTAIRFRDRDGTVIRLYCKLALLYREHEPQIFFQAIDITELESAKIDLEKAKHQAEILDFERREEAHTAEIFKLRNVELMELNNRLNDLLSEKEEILGLVAHDLKTPLTTINLNADLLQHCSKSVDDPKFLLRVEKIKSLCWRMLDIVKLLLETGELDFGQSEISKDCIELNQFIIGIINDNQAHASRKSIEIILEKPEETLFIEGDARKLSLVLENLISNALKFSFLEQEIKIKLFKINHLIQIEVCDSGQGLTESDLKNLFQRYSRLSAQPTGGESSSGLGLYIAKHWVEKMNGSIQAYSPGRNQGAIFTVSFRAHVFDQVPSP